MVIVVRYAKVVNAAIAPIAAMLRWLKRPSEPPPCADPRPEPVVDDTLAWVQLSEPVEVVPDDWPDIGLPALPAEGVALSTLDPSGYVTETTSAVTIFVTAQRPRLAPGTAVRIIPRENGCQND